MKRKVCQVGPATLYVSLPSKWAKANNIKKGDEVEVAEEGSELNVSVGKLKPRERKTILDITNLGTYSMRCLAAIYRKGYDEVEIKSSKPGFIKEVQNLVRDLIGFEIVKQGKNYCIIRSISTELEGEFDSVLRRTFLLLLSMAEDSLGIIRKGNLEALNDIYHLEETNNKFTTFCRRLLLRRGSEKGENTSLIYFIVEELEKIADEYKYLCYYLANTKDRTRPSRETLEIYAKVSGMLRDFYNLFYEFDLKKSLELSEQRKAIIKEGYNIFDRSTKKDARILYHLLNITQMTANMSTVYLVTKL